MNKRTSQLGVRIAVGSGVVLAGAFAIQPIQDPDIGWLLRSGRLIWETGAVPTTDPFSHTATGATWTHHSGLWGLLLFAVWSGAGFGGIRVANAALAALITLRLWRVTCKSTAEPAARIMV